MDKEYLFKLEQSRWLVSQLNTAQARVAELEAELRAINTRGPLVCPTCDATGAAHPRPDRQAEGDHAMVMADVTDEMVEQGAEAAYENWRAGYVDATPFPSKPPLPWSELDNAKRFPTLENTRAALSAVAPLIAAHAYREAYDVAHAFARTGVDGILARLVDLMDGEIMPSDAVAQARREALEEAAAAVEKRAIELGRQECCGRPVGYQEPECCGDPLFMIANEEAATAIRALLHRHGTETVNEGEK